MIVEIIYSIFAILIRLIVLASIYGYVKYVYQTKPEFTKFSLFLVGLDRLITMTMASMTFAHAFFFLFSMRLVNFIFIEKFNFFNHKVSSLVQKGKICSILGLLPSYRQEICLPKVKKYCFEHNQIATFLGHMNKVMISWDILLFGVSNMPFNIYLITRLMLGYKAQVLIFAVLVLQLYIVSIGAVPMMRINATVVVWSKIYRILLRSFFHRFHNRLFVVLRLNLRYFMKLLILLIIFLASPLVRLVW